MVRAGETGASSMSWVEIIADRKIRDAQDEGKFDNLHGAGKSLILEFDPNVPPDHRMAYRLMREANLLPDWIEAEKEIRTLQARWYERVALFRKRTRDEAGDGSATTGFKANRLDAHRNVFLLQAARELLESKRQIERFNLIVPAVNRQMVRLSVREMMQELEVAFPCH